MALFIAHSCILLLASFAGARQLLRHPLDWIVGGLVIAWSNIVVTSLALSCIHRLGEPDWFFRVSLLGAIGTWLCLRRISPEPVSGNSPSDPKDTSASPLILWAFFLTLLPLAYASVRIGYTYEPNNYDSLSYHLPRVMFYLGQDSLAHFDTGNPRQIFFPFNYNLLQLFGLIYGPPIQTLTFFNLLSWVVCGIGVYRTCRLCAIGPNAALVTSWLMLTATQVLAQATATTNDLPVGAALLSAIFYGLQWRHTKLTRHAIMAGLSVGLAAGSKLTIFYFGPAGVLLALIFVLQHWRNRTLPVLWSNTRAWVLPGFVAAILSAPFAIINLVEKGQWMTKSYDFILNKPFSLFGALQTSAAYLTQLLLEPIHRFTYNPTFTALLNDWGSRFLFPHWNETYAISGLYLFPPDLNEDHVWFGFVGPLILICAFYCLWRNRKLEAPISWFALLGIGWMLAFFCLNKWSLYNQRYFIPVMLIMSPCLAATIEACLDHPRSRRYARNLLLGVAITALWLAGVYLFYNTSRPYAPLWEGKTPPPALPTLPVTMGQRLATQKLINIDSDDGNERIFLLMTLGKHQRFTASEDIKPNAYNVFSRWGWPRGMAWTNIEQLASHIAVPFPTKLTAGVEFLGTIGQDVAAIDYYGLVPHANRTASTNDDRNLFVTLSYGPTNPNRYAKTRIRVAGLNPLDHARLVVGLDDENDEKTTLAQFTESGENTVSVSKPFHRFTFSIIDETSGAEVGSAVIPHEFREASESPIEPRNQASVFVADLINNSEQNTISTVGLGLLEGPYPQWKLPQFRWAKAPSLCLIFTPDETVKRVQVKFSIRLHIRDSANLDVRLNGQILQNYRLEGRDKWFDQTIEFIPKAGENVLEFADVVLTDKPDWMEYLARYPDVKDYLVSQNLPLKSGAEDHYNSFGRKENRILHMQRVENHPPTTQDSLYFIFRELKVEGFKTP